MIDTHHSEAPASITLSIKSPNGYDVLFTLRNTNLEGMINDLLESEARLSKLGYLPKGGSTYIAQSPQNTAVAPRTPQQPIIWDDTILCDNCRSYTRIISGIAKKTGKPYKMRVCKNNGSSCNWKTFEN